MNIYEISIKNVLRNMLKIKKISVTNCKYIANSNGI